MPMFIRRVMVPGASLVCSVESTRWPVSAALMAISAVSKSRISPTRMMFGSCRRKDAQRGGEVQPDLLLHLHLVDAGQLELDRVFRRHDVGVGPCSASRSMNRECWSCRFRSGRSPAPCRKASEMLRLELGQRLRLETELGHVEHQVFLVEQTQHDFFAEQRGQC